MAKKPKNVQPETPDEVQGRDQMYTPRYAVDIILPFIPKWVHRILEPACGNGKIVKYLQEKGYDVEGRDINTGSGYKVKNFLDNIGDDDIGKFDMILTNPPFSIKAKFIKQAIKMDLPFAFLIPFDISGFLIDAFDKYNCQGIVPERRIDFITPNILENIYKSQLKKLIEKETQLKFKNHFSIPIELLEKHSKKIEKYENIDDCPNEILAKHSSSQFHSFWLTRYLNLSNQLIFSKLSLLEKKNI